MTYYKTETNPYAVLQTQSHAFRLLASGSVNSFMQLDRTNATQKLAYIRRTLTGVCICLVKATGNCHVMFHPRPSPISTRFACAQLNRAQWGRPAAEANTEFVCMISPCCCSYSWGFWYHFLTVAHAAGYFCLPLLMHLKSYPCQYLMQLGISVSIISLPLLLQLGFSVYSVM